MPENTWALAVVAAVALAFATYLIGLRSAALGIAPRTVRRAQVVLWAVAVFIFCALATAGHLVGYNVRHATAAEIGHAAIPFAMALGAAVGLLRYLNRTLRFGDNIDLWGGREQDSED